MFFGILGATEARDDDGNPVSVGGPRVRSLLALLVLDAGKVVTTERLIDGLYGDEPPAGAANALQSQVSRLRRGLRDEGGLVEFHPAGYRLAVDPDSSRHTVDLHRFERLADEGHRALAAGDHARAATLLRDALHLWRGPALADIPFAAAQRTRLDELRLTAAEDHAEAALALGEHRALIAELQQLVTAHPLRERLRALLMRALYGSGRQAEALAVFEDARRTLAEELGADPSAELAEVHLAILRAEPALPSTAPATSVRSNLPAQLTNFVGRDEELRRIAKLLGTGRLVTLTGPGGAGKTRLAIEAAGREQDEACFVDLAAVDISGVPQALLDALGLRETALLPSAPGPQDQPPEPVTRLIAALAERRLLLILDNCEHVIDAVAQLTHRLLGACPHLRVLATSREALGITGEALLPLPPLALPPPGTDPGAALGYPAVRLFADRAMSVRPDFEPGTDVDADVVVRICRALDGMPLAIELAAARLRSLTLDDVSARLDDRFRLLSRGDRTKAPRHRTLRAVVEWSWDLLTEAEQTLAARLTVFAGGATLDAAAQVCGLPDVDELLASLVDKSLLQGDGGRYRMLDTVRVFCAERLPDDETARLRATHAAYFLDLAEVAAPYLFRAEQLDWVTRLDAERGNLMAALRWAVRADQAVALRLLAALAAYWWLRGQRSEGAPLARDLLERIGAESPAGLVEEYIICVMIATHGGAVDPALTAHAEQAESAVLGLDRPFQRPVALVLRAMTHGPPVPESDLELEKALVRPDPWPLALLHFGVGFRDWFRGDLTGAEAEFELGLAAFRALGERWGMSGMLSELARLADWRGDRVRARALIDEALGLLEEIGAAEDTSDLLCLRAEVLTHAGDLVGARDDYERAAAAARRSGAPEKLAQVRCGLGDVARLSGDLAEARRLLEPALTESAGGAFSAEWARASVLIALGWLADAQGDAAEARSQHRQALDAAVDWRILPIAAEAVEGLAGAALLDGAGERAAVLLGVGVALRGTAVFGDPDVARVAARCRELIGAAAYATAYERGAGMSHEEALALVSDVVSDW